MNPPALRDLSKIKIKIKIKSKMSSPIENRLAAGETLILDGALATELEARGHDLNHPLWSARLLLENPAAIREVHEDYLRAGADIITTASYQASLPALAREGLDPAASAELLHLSGSLAAAARDAIRPDALIAASIGPYGAYLADGSEYSGNYRIGVEQLVTFHREPTEILTKSPIDLLTFETIPSLTEAEALAEILSYHTHHPAWIAFQCRDEGHLADGAPITVAAGLFDSPPPNVIAIGTNGTSPKFLLGRAAGAASRVASAEKAGGQISRIFARRRQTHPVARWARPRGAPASPEPPEGSASPARNA